MKAFVSRSYGPPDVLTLTEIPVPAPRDDEVLVRVRAGSVNPYDWHNMRGEPYLARLMPGGLALRTPKITILGADISGQVESVGRNVTEFRPGDDVFAVISGGGFAEYVCVRESDLAPKPENLSYEEAAAVPMAANTALLALRDEGHILPGQRVLINGASGGVGTFAVQLARALGTEVTGVCSARNVDLVHSLGAAKVIDYTTQDFTRETQRYDLFLDIAGSRPVSVSRRILRPKGAYVVVGGLPGRWIQPMGHVLSALAVSRFVGQRISVADALKCPSPKENLRTLSAFLNDKRVIPIIARRYPFEEIPRAIGYLEEGHAPGKVVISV
ncbi:NAD(P)-dependent alcohol dehydrogenase [Microtetraspora sp. AC03309]|uniref:NAD(P)-dependent alcohol dehydrogenase n=1 Tax=Microtetraspora sp. AC03309 TaxID=2779376 RepID=UPI001E3A250B|nr:NAD(P)-dependent alcohol dehydrogenase [Microtetraspora sp. AC03309]MCC5581701.1 NAD(P)-dependent alcohol dehydrogenase [Microtetraspora sp. AC03309]